MTESTWGAMQSARDTGHGTVRPMRELLILGIHVLVTVAKLVRPGGARAVAAESLIFRISCSSVIAPDNVRRISPQSIASG